MSDKKDGGPEFSNSGLTGLSAIDMDMLDEFAAAALTGLCSNPSTKEDTPLAVTSYLLAHDMLRARQKTYDALIAEGEKDE